MKKKIVWLVILVFMQTSMAWGQFSKYRQFGVKAGMNISNVRVDLSTYNSKDVLGSCFGLTYDRVRMRFLTIGTEVNFIQKGYGKELTLVNAMNQPLGSFVSENRINYISIPLKLGIQLGNRFYIFGTAAIIPALVYKAVAEVPVFDANGKVSSAYSEDIKDEVSILDLASQVEVGFGITRGRFKFYLSGAKMDSFVNLWDDPSTVFNIKSTGLIAAAGMKIEFGKGLLK